MAKKNKSNVFAVSFNRYMVECEFGSVVETRTPDRVLIDTWWNVNKERITASSCCLRF